MPPNRRTLPSPKSRRKPSKLAASTSDSDAGTQTQALRYAALEFPATSLFKLKSARATDRTRQTIPAICATVTTNAEGVPLPPSDAKNLPLQIAEAVRPKTTA